MCPRKLKDKSPERKLDNIHIQILRIVQKEARTRAAAIGKRVGLDEDAVRKRLKWLEEKKYIIGFNAKLNPEKFQMGTLAYVTVYVKTPRPETFLNLVKESWEILECHTATGPGTFLLKTLTHDNQKLAELTDRIQMCSGVLKTITRIVLSTQKETSAIQIDDLGSQDIDPAKTSPAPTSIK